MVSPPWRLAVFMLGCAMGVLFLRVIVPLMVAVLEPGRQSQVPMTWVLAGGLLIGHTVTFRVVDPRGWSFVGLGWRSFRPGALACGIVSGAAAIGLPSLALLAIGWLTIEPAPAGSAVGAVAAMAFLLLPAALWEELLVRGYFFSTLRENWGGTRAILATSIVFGLIHLQNAGATAQSVLLVTLAGVFLGAIRLVTDSLYAAWAAHFSWNFVMAAGLHAPVSGITVDVVNYRAVDSGPTWATGGAWGPEAGLFAAAGMIAGLAILRWRRMRQQEHGT